MGQQQQQQQNQNKSSSSSKRKKYQNNKNNNQHMNGYHHHSQQQQPQSRATASNGDKLYVGDKILLVNKRSGKVTSLGPKRDKDGIWVRVAMDNADNDSSKAIWVPINRVNRILSEKSRLFDFTIDDRVVDRNKGVA